MADLKISGATPNPSPAPTDSFATNKAGVDFQTTLAQILAAIIFPPPPPEINDLSAAVTWADIPDTNVPESAVTQHQAAIDHNALLNFLTSEHFTQAAISITASQISDIAAAVAALEVNDLTAAVVWADIPDGNVPESAVTQHQAALAILRAQLTDLATVSQAEAEAGTATNDRIWTAERVKQAIAALGKAFPEILYNAVDFDNPNNADWSINALAPAVADSNNAALTIRAFDDTIIEGVGGFLRLPIGATSFKLDFVGRAETAPPGTRRVRMSFRVRKIPDNAVVNAPPWITGNLTNFDIPTNEFFQFDSQTLTFAFFGFVPGELIQFELVRVAATGGTDLVGDYNLLRLNVSFT